MILQRKDLLHKLKVIGMIKNSLSLTQPNSKVPCLVHQTLPLGPILSKTNPVHTHPSYSLNTHFNIISRFTATFSEWFLPFILHRQYFESNSVTIPTIRMNRIINTFSEVYTNKRIKSVIYISLQMYKYVIK
jgi:hypothetical protein